MKTFLAGRLQKEQSFAKKLLIFLVPYGINFKDVGKPTEINFVSPIIFGLTAGFALPKKRGHLVLYIKITVVVKS